MKIVYTIGYTSFDIQKFVEVLKKYKITCLIDVRSTPKSSYYKDFDDSNLLPLLKNNGILYRNYKEEFGARQDNKDFYSLHCSWPKEQDDMHGNRIPRLYQNEFWELHKLHSR